jgi:tyrosyl-tRNA synthetase
VPLRKLRQFQQLGHRPVLIIGTVTAQVGDPSGGDDSCRGLDLEQIAKNAETDLTQIAKVIDISNAEVRPNGDWFSDRAVIEHIATFSHHQHQQSQLTADVKVR